MTASWGRALTPTMMPLATAPAAMMTIETITFGVQLWSTEKCTVGTRVGATVGRGGE